MDALPPHAPSTPPDGRIAGAEAARRRGIARQVVNRWCRQNPDLAIRWDGRWWLIPERFDAFVAARRGGGHAQG